MARGSSCPEDDTNDALTLLVREGRNLRPLLQRNLSQWQLLKNDVCSTATGMVVGEHAKWSLSAADYARARAGDVDIALSANSVTIPIDPGADSTTEQTRRARQVVHATVNATRLLQAPTARGRSAINPQWNRS